MLHKDFLTERATEKSARGKRSGDHWRAARVLLPALFLSLLGSCASTAPGVRPVAPVEPVAPSALRVQSSPAPASPEAADPVDTLRSWLDANEQYRPLTMSFGTLTYEETGIGSSLSRHVEQLVGRAAQASPHWEFVDGGTLRHLGPEVRERLADQFQVENFDTLMSGRYSVNGNEITVDLDLMNIRTGLRIGSVQMNLDRRALPRGVDPLPPNLQAALRLGLSLGGEVPLQTSNLDVQAAVDRGPGGVYRNGEEMHLYLYANEDVFVKVYHVGVNGDIQLIFPNEFHSGNRLRANTLTTIPGTTYPFAFELGAPYGTEYIQVLASRTQFQDIEASFEALGSVESYRTRGLSVRQRQQAGEVREIRLAYSIVE